MPELKPLPTLPNYPELIAALELQRGRHKKRNPKSKSKLKLNDLHTAFGTVVGALGRDKLNMFTPERLGGVETFTFTHTSDGLILPIDDVRVPFPMDTTPTVKRFISDPLPQSDHLQIEHKIDETLQWIMQTERSYSRLITGIQIDHPRLTDPEFETGATDFICGYDIETQSNETVKFDLKTRSYIKAPSQIVSHQFYFNFQGVRFGVVFLTNHRISQTNFVAIINGAVPKIENLKILRTVLVYAHFSVMENGWMKTGSRKLLTPNAFSSITRDVPLIHERNVSWHGYTPLRTFITKTATGKLVENKINLLFCDSMQLQAASLKKLGKDISLDKVELEKGVISQMAQFLIDDPKKFIEYAIIDAVITAEVHLFFYNLGKSIAVESDGMGVNIVSGTAKNTMPSYSGAFFRRLFESHYKKDWKQYLGYAGGKEMTDVCKMFVRFYHGGRNDAVHVGPTNETHYLDLHSAYLSGVAMLPDYDFSDAHISTGVDAENVISELMSNGLGPFQVVGVECTFVFKKGAKPIFPVRIAEAENLPGAAKSYSVDGLIYPMTGATCATWPEFWVAEHHGLLEQRTINRITTFRMLHAAPVKTGELMVTDAPTYSKWFAGLIMQLIIDRSTSESAKCLYLKNILNFTYGKFCAGIGPASAAIKNHDFSANFAGSAVTCYPLASFITGFTRSCVSELMNFNKCRAVTTDGFITSVSREQLITPAGGLCQMVQDSFTARGFTAKPFLGTEASGNCGIFLKTRGYAIIDTETLVDGLPPTPAQCLKKMAAIGVQVNKYDSDDPIRDFLEKIFTGYADKSYFVKLTKIRAEQVSNPDAVTEKRLSLACKIDMTYDMKHVPVNIENRSITWAGKTYFFPSFDTIPLHSSVDFHLLRSLRRRDHGRDLQVLWPGLSDPAFSKMTLAYTGDLPMPVSPAWTCLEFDTVLPVVHEKDLIDAYFRDTVGMAVDNYFCSFADIPKELVGVHIPKSLKTLDFNYTTHRVALIELLINMREIPSYMVFGDYAECMERFYKFSDSDYERSAPIVINAGSGNDRRAHGFYTEIGDIND